MQEWRDNSQDFNIGKPKYPHVLDLRQKTARGILPKIRKKPRKKEEAPSLPLVPKADEALLQEYVLRELAGIESRDVELASSLNLASVPTPKQTTPSVPFAIVRENGEQKITLARGLISEGLGIQNDDLVSNFFLKTAEAKPPEQNETRNLSVNDGRSENIWAYISGARIFIIIAALVAGFLFGGFFVNRGIALKEQSIERGFAAYKNLAAAKDALKNFNFSAANKDFSQAYENLVSAEEELQKIGSATIVLVKNLPFESKTDSALALLNSAKHAARAGEFLSAAFTFLPLENAVSAGAALGVLTGFGANTQVGYLTQVFDSFAEKLIAAENELFIAQSEISKVKADDFPEEFRGNIAEFKQRIPALLMVIKISKDYAAVSALLLGKDSPKRYLFLFQNSSELRPTGGFIGTYGLLEFENGGLKNMLVEGIYEADGQLTVNIVPPKPFQHIATAWSTHDANWFLDFPTSARKVAWFFERTGGGKVDGVIALNIEVVERLLALTGPIEIKEYDLVIGANNFRDEIQYEVEAAYDKKLNKPKKVLTDFTPLFLSKLLEVSKVKNREIIDVIINALEEKYIMLYFQNPEIQKFFENQGWGGSLTCQLSIVNCQLSDYLAVVHSNIGGYKTDKFMEDSADYSVTIKDDGSILNNLVIKRKHNGGKSQYWWYNRKNVDYVKIYAPKDSEIVSASGGERRNADAPDYAALGFIGDADIAKIEQGTKFFGSVDVFEENGMTVFGTWLVTSPGSSSELKISYKLPFRVDFRNGAGKYNLYWQKQPGTKISAKFAVDPPDNWEVVWDNANTQGKSQDFVLDKDRVVGYIFR